MKTNPRLPLRLFALPLFALVIKTPAAAQSAAADATPAQLAKYDANRNGRLDADELALMQSDEAKMAGATTDGSGKVVAMSPFTVASDKDSGYYAQNTLFG